MRFALGILTFAALVAASPAAVQAYRLTGAFDYADGDFESLMGTSFTFDFAAAYELSSVGLTTDLGHAAGYGAATIGLDPEYGSAGFGATKPVGEDNFLSYGLALGDLPPVGSPPDRPLSC